MDLIYTNDSMSAVGYLDVVGFDESIGDSGNQIQVKLHSQQQTELAQGSLVYSPGTEYGGIIQDIQSKLETDGQRYVYYSGPSWSGRLAQKVIKPPSGQDHYTMNGEANECINELMAYLGLDDLFKAPDTDSGITLNIELDRFADAFSALRKGLATSDARLSTVYDNAQKCVVIQAVQRETHGGYTSDNSPISVTVATPVNHLVCAGTGEMQDRVVIDLYVQADGSIGETPYYTGLDMIDSLYENTTADATKLREEGEDKLIELQNVNQVSISVDDGSEDLYPLDDVITGLDPVTGIQASSTIAKKVVSVDANGFETYRYEAADVGSTVQTNLSSETSGGSGDGGATYTEGYGINITNNQISAEIGPDELEGVEEIAQTANTNASNAAAEAGQAISNAAAAQATADAAVATVGASTPLSATREGREVSLMHDNSGVSAGAYGATDNKTADWGETVTVGARMSVNATGHVTNAQGRTVTLPSNTATQDAKGLMSAVDKAKLDGIAQGANKTTVDTALSATSINPVQNKAVKEALDDKANSEHSHSASDITSGYLPLSRGGLGGGTATASLYNLIANSIQEFSDTDISGIYVALVDAYGTSTDPIIKAVSPANFAAGLVTLITPDDIGALSKTGNAASASKLQTKRTITLTGAVNGSAEFDGSGDITITTTGDSEAAGFLAAHPVGSIYATSDPTDPGVTYGGTWEQLQSADSFKFLRTA